MVTREKIKAFVEYQKLIGYVNERWHLVYNPSKSWSEWYTLALLTDSLEDNIVDLVVTTCLLKYAEEEESLLREEAQLLQEFLKLYD